MHSFRHMTIARSHYTHGYTLVKYTHLNFSTKESTARTLKELCLITKSGHQQRRAPCIMNSVLEDRFDLSGCSSKSAFAPHLLSSALFSLWSVRLYVGIVQP